QGKAICSPTALETYGPGWMEWPQSRTRILRLFRSAETRGPEILTTFETTMSYENILYDTKDGIATITFNRPKVLNALNRKTVEELQSALLNARDDANVRVVILTGAGEKAFVAGADIGELARQTPVAGKDFSLFGQSVFHLLETLGKPSICAINGFALGG